MIKFVYTTLLIVLFTNVSLNAQNPKVICGYEQEVKKLIAKNPNYMEWQSSVFEKAKQANLESQSSKRRLVADTEYYEIPVVFHVVYKTAAQNLSDAVIMSQFNALNEDFRKRNADTIGIRSIFKSLASDVRIQFKLATLDPNGNPTTGITRRLTTNNNFATNFGLSYTEDMKKTSTGGENAWNPVKYLNIWICNMDYGPGRAGIVYGFAIPPTGAPNWGQFSNIQKDTNDVLSGVVLHYEIVGVNNPLSPASYKKGNTATHEIGHYLGLRHIWGDGNSCSQSDGIDDTPFASGANSTCSNQNSCNEGANDKPDMTENYMDYALDVCGAMFTKQQAYTMRYVLQNFRTGLPIRKISYDTVADYSTTDLNIYPNPLKYGQSLVVNITAPTQKNLTIKFIDAIGRTIEEKSVKTNYLNHINTETYAKGLYFVVLIDGNGIIITTKKLIVGL